MSPYRPTYTANTVEDVNRDSNAGLQSLVGNLMQIQARKEARARQQMLDERQREIDRMAAEDRARQIQQEEEDRKLKADLLAEKLKQEAAAQTKPLPAVKGPQVSIGPSSVKIQAPDIPAELMPTHETPEQFDERNIAQEGFDLPLGAGMNEKAPDVPELRQYGASTKIRLPGGETVETPLKYKSDIEEEQNQTLKVIGDALGVDLTGMGQVPPNLLPTLVSAVGRRKEESGPRIEQVGKDLLQINKDGTIKLLYKSTEPDGSGAGGVLIPITNPAGNIVGFYNNRTGAFQSAEGLPEGARRSGVAATEMAQRGSLESIINDAKTLAELAAGEAGKVIGPVSGTYKGMTRGVLGASPDVQDLFHISDNLADQLLRARSGAQINEQEFKRLRVLVPNPRDARSKFDADLRRFTLEAQNVLAARQGKPIGGAAPEGPPPGQSLTVGKYKVTVE